MYYWIVCIGKDNGRAFLERNYYLSQEAAEDAASNMPDKTMVFSSKHSNRTEAAREIREQLERGGHGEWSHNFQHKVPSREGR
jgi:hypothetical protein